MFGLDEYSAMAEIITPPACLLEINLNFNYHCSLQIYQYIVMLTAI